MDPSPLIQAAAADAAVGGVVGDTFTLIEKVVADRNDEILATVAANEQLEASNANLQTQLDTMTTMTTSLQAQVDILTRAVETFATGATKAKSIAKDPSSFSGGEDDAVKRHTEYTTWRSKIKIRHLQDAHEFPAEFNKILHIVGCLSGDAYLSIKTDADNIIENPNDATKWKWPSAADLLKHLDKQYDTIDLAADASREWDALEQKNKWANFRDFITQFILLANRADLDKATRVRGLRAKVNGKIRNAIVHQVPTPARDDWDTWLELVRSLAENIADDENDRQLRNRGNNSFNNNTNNANKANPQAAAATVSQGGIAMDLDALHLNKVSDEEMQRRLTLNLCKYCGEPGHYAVNCVKKVANRGGRGRGRGTNQRGRGAGPTPGSRGPAQQQQYPYSSYHQPPANLTPTFGYSGQALHQPSHYNPYGVRMVDVPNPGWVLGDAASVTSHSTSVQQAQTPLPSQGEASHASNFDWPEQTKE